MEVHKIANGKILNDHRAGVGIAKVRYKFASLILTQDVEESHADFLIDPNKQQLRIIVLDLYLLSNHWNGLLQGPDFRPYVFLDLGLGQSLAIHDDQVWDAFCRLVIVLCPVFKYWIKHSLWYFLFFFDTNDRLWVNLRASFVDSTDKCQSESLCSFA